MNRYLYISGGAHALLFVWVLLGNVFASDPPQMQVADVTILSEEQFAALTALPTPAPAPEPAPEPEPEPAPEPQPEPQPVPTPEPLPIPDPQPEPAPISQPEPEPTPAPVPLPLPLPLPEPDPVPAPPGPQPAPLPSALAPTSSSRPKPRPADRIADTPVAPPDPGTDLAEEQQDAADPDAADSADILDEVQEATAPPETTTEIVTEAEEPSAPVSSMRPKARPQRAAQAAPQPQPDPAPAPQTEPAVPDPVSEADVAIAAALAEALAGISAPDAPSGPPLTAGEQRAFQLAVQPCWLVDVGGQAADVTVVVGFEMERDGTVVTETVRLVSSSGGAGAAVQTAFNKARVAILRCQSQGRNGYELPEEKYEQWKEVEMTFNPREMSGR
jgi:hypothetical protein